MTQLTRRNVLLLAVVMAAATTFVAYLFLTRQQVRALDREDKTATQTMVVVARQDIRPLQLLHGNWFAVKQVRADGVPRDAVATRASPGCRSASTPLRRAADAPAAAPRQAVPG